MLYYPVDATVRDGRVELKLEDINCLKPEGYLNDQVVDFYLKYIHLEKQNPVARETIYLFSSLFYTSLQSYGNATSLRPDKQSGWTRRIRNLFDKKFLVIPVVTNGHWILAIICNAGKANRINTEEPDSKRFKHNDGTSMGNGNGSGKTEDETPMILLLDSFQDYSSVNRSLIGATLRSFLTKEWTFRRTTAFKFNEDNLPLVIPKVPQQSNLFDCGIYTLQFFETFFLVPLSSWQYCFRTLSDSWFRNFTEEIEKDKREQVFQAILSLLREHFGSTNYLSILPAKSKLLPVSSAVNLSEKMDPVLQISELTRRGNEIQTVVKFFFDRHGQRLGRNLSLPALSINVGPPAKVEIENLQATMGVDNTLPKTKVHIRMSDGSRLPVTLNPTQPVSKIREYICLIYPDQAARSFSLMTTFPSKELSDESISIAEAQLNDAVVTQKLK